MLFDFFKKKEKKEQPPIIEQSAVSSQENNFDDIFGNTTVNETSQMSLKELTERHPVKRKRGICR